MIVVMVLTSWHRIPFPQGQYPISWIHAVRQKMKCKSLLKWRLLCEEVEIFWIIGSSLYFFFYMITLIKYTQDLIRSVERISDYWFKIGRMVSNDRVLGALGATVLWACFGRFILQVRLNKQFSVTVCLFLFRNTVNRTHQLIFQE